MAYKIAFFGAKPYDIASSIRSMSGMSSIFVTIKDI